MRKNKKEILILEASMSRWMVKGEVQNIDLFSQGKLNPNRVSAKFRASVSDSVLNWFGY